MSQKHQKSNFLSCTYKWDRQLSLCSLEWLLSLFSKIGTILIFCSHFTCVFWDVYVLQGGCLGGNEGMAQVRHAESICSLPIHWAALLFGHPGIPYWNAWESPRGGPPSELWRACPNQWGSVWVSKVTHYVHWLFFKSDIIIDLGHIKQECCAPTS